MRGIQLHHGDITFKLSVNLAMTVRAEQVTLFEFGLDHGTPFPSPDLSKGEVFLAGVSMVKSDIRGLGCRPPRASAEGRTPSGGGRPHSESTLGYVAPPGGLEPPPTQLRRLAHDPSCCRGVALPEGLEPSTFAFVGRCSIHRAEGACGEIVEGSRFISGYTRT